MFISTLGMRIARWKVEEIDTIVNEHENRLRSFHSIQMAALSVHIEQVELRAQAVHLNQ
jgi:hypothetical protein